ncbi:MAG: low molecular weight protein arginine phosphatase [Candidatus Omnitrophica bacterium CG07_land_8_20_14_0_80_50_8]|nr:MAG: low molecular weight protein arginine phosphatase [Candidatus Omnitrophica bacterium CG07_land_8_20_14_0_80_50_8]
MKILFVCTGNSCRSVMAEGLFKKLTQARANDFEVSSAGISAIDGFPASPETLEVMKTEGVDVSGHVSRRLNAEMVRAADKIFVMEKTHRDWIVRFVPEAKDKLFLMTDFYAPAYEHTGCVDIPDPIQMSDSFYQNVLSMIRDCLEKIVQSL